jgi:hypothetical protein
MSKLNVFLLAFVGLVAVAHSASLPFNFQQLPEQLKGKEFLWILKI